MLALVSNLVAPGSGEWVATAAIGLSSMGNNANQKLIEGHDKLSAYTYGAITGASEALLEKLLGNIGFLNEGASFSLKGILSEISGELIQMGVESYVNEAMYGELVDANALGEEALKTVIYTALLSGLSTGGQTISNIAINGSKANITNFSSFCDFVGMMNSGDISLVKNSDGKYTCVLKSDADVSSSMLAEIESMFPGVPIMQNVSDESMYSTYVLTFQTIYGLVSMIAPTSLLVVFAVKYFDVPYTSFVKYIWRFVLMLFLLVLLVLLVLALI